MSAVLAAQPGLHSMAMAVSMKVKKRGKKRKRKKSTMVGRACATQGIQHKKSQGTSPHPQPCAFSLVNSLDLYDPSSHPSFSPGQNLSPSPNVFTPPLPLIAPALTPPSSPLGHPDSLPNMLWNPEDPQIPILRSIGFTVDRWTFPDELPTWDQVHRYEQQHLHGISFDPVDDLDCAFACHCVRQDSFPSSN